ncbi:PAS domain-containing hybrid sensor histidine kinase/response regulator [Mucilaginibacter pedocola]|uniref:Sensory/regulatory protein RpfC n=1 Tax=Mucilaginibacter pedocola TaxID=1792845 RepID=A0A1S9P6Y5_9SPHI|nr:PAS domain-containing hybrid sensor histidine kinase/response regulator [Mucilaginibacter pedocola]OOQ56714.1 hypothetical protein BC343_17105 [Mucilaginibacter pedocola]
MQVDTLPCKGDFETNGYALLTEQNPDPLFCIGVGGNILSCNPAAALLNEFVFNGAIYPIADFWRYFAEQGNYTADNFSFEVSALGNEYSFVCRYLPGQIFFNVYGREITCAKKARQEFARLSLVASANDNGVLFNDAQGKVLWANQSFCKLTGYTVEEVLGKKTLDFCSGPLTDNAILIEIAAAIGVCSSFDKELIHYRKNGTWFWGRVRGQSFQNTAGELEYFAVVEDISREKDRDEKLKVLSQIAENNINAVIITDKEGVITWVNKSFTTITGYTAAQALGCKPGHLLQGPDTDKETIAYLKNQISSGQPFSTEILNYNRSGSPYWLRIQGQPITNDNGELTGFFALEEDVTAEKQVQSRIRESEEQFKLALEKIGDNVWEHDFTTGKTNFYKSTDELWAEGNTEGSDRMGWWVNVHHEDLDLLKTNYHQYKTGSIRSHNLEYRILHADGTIKWVLDKGVVLQHNEKGLPLKTIGTHTDITLIKQTEIELEQRVKQFKSLSENIPGVIYEYEFRADGTEGLRYVSPAVERVFGISAANFMNYGAYVQPADMERIREKNQQSKRTLQPFYDESQIFIPGQKPKWHSVHSSFSYISQNGSKVFTGYMKDITERKTIEASLRANEEKYRNIIANMNLGLLEVDRNGMATYANQSFCDMSGYTQEQLMGKDAGKLFLSNGHDEILAEKKLKRERGISDAYELEVQDKAGRKRWWLISGAPRYNDKRELIGSMGIHLDITNQKLQEAELVAARVKAEQLAQAKDAFLANMSHEIRTPMNAILGMSNQLVKTTLTAQQQFYLNTILSASDTLLVIINDILDLSKIEAGKLAIEEIGFELHKVISQVGQVIAHKAEEKGLNLCINTPPASIRPVLLGDPYRISQVIINLLSNAVKFTQKGTVSLTCNLLQEKYDSQLIEIVVEDTGIGMEQAFVEKLFEKFSQEYESMARQFGGTGLGMSICKELLALMNGDIKVTSRKGYGTKVTIVLELRHGSQKHLPQKNSDCFAPGFLTGKKVLVTDDNELNRLVASIILQNYGGTVITAQNGQEALLMIEQQRPDVVLMDVQMPVLNGLDATRTIRERGYQLPVIALTAAAIKGEREKCIAAGMNDYITKPFKETEFLRTINDWFFGEKLHFEMKLYNLDKLKEISRGNEAFVKRMVDIFCSQTPGLVADMVSAYHNNDLVKMGAIAHQLKPSIENLEIAKLQQVVKSIENIGKERTENVGLAELISEAEAITDIVIKQMKTEYPD